ncbi:MAG: choice-of-anchor J domain-containing protein [Bacteroidota bacterium]|nr:choice-of-anchor J domain-containing protein [Bacteroidota bacterium]
MPHALRRIILFSVALFMMIASSLGQLPSKPLDARKAVRCATMVRLNEAIEKDPSLPAKWKIEGEKQYHAYLQRKTNERGAQVEQAEIVIPIVFHLIDSAAAQSWITDRDIYEQVEILNKAYGGIKADFYRNVIPREIYSRLGRIPIRFVLARRTPSGALTTGIERRVNTTPDRVGIKSTSSGGLDAWDVTRYVNVWCGTFTGGDDGLLGIATFPFTTTEGPQGVVISIATLPYASNVSRSYYPAYSEGATLCHELGHYFYLWHTFGDQTYCNNDDFRIEAGWPLPAGAGPEGDDTPEEKGDTANAEFGNPSMNYSDGCTSLSFGEMYGSFMNYFDDRALFMFSDGMRKRVQGCIDLYRPGLKNSNGATPPVPVTDAYLVTVSPRGIPERRHYMENNTPLSATIRNNGTAALNNVTINVMIDGSSPATSPFPLNLSAGEDTVLSLGVISASPGTHTLTIYTSAPNNGTDQFTNNDTIQSFIYINGSLLNAPFTEDFSEATFPPPGWQIWNPNKNTTWTRSATSGFPAAGSATIQNNNYQGGGQLDDLISPPINVQGFDSSVLSFKVAYAVYDTVDVSVWDGIEVYISGDGGMTYHLVYKKTGDQLRTVIPPMQASFVPLPSEPSSWRLETINLTPYLVRGKNLLIKFRNTNAYGNNTYIDDINVAGYISVDRDASVVSVGNLSDLLCVGAQPTPTVVFASNGRTTLNSLKINYLLDNGNVNTISWTGTLTRGQTAQISLPALAGLTAGNHTLTVFTSNPNGLNDQFPSNDTIRKSFYVFGKVSLPITEGFEETTFPPPNWAISNPDGGITWERTTTTAKTGVASMVIRNYDYTSTGTVDKFVSSVITGNPAFDSVFLSFDYAYAVGTNASLPDTFEIQSTADCNQTNTTLWKKWGTDLQTSTNIGGARFTPLPSDWAHVKIYLSPTTGNNDFQINFVAESNAQNNLYVDNINIYGVTVPPLLKKQGYLFYPSPFRQQFVIRNYQVPTTLQSAAIYNSVGQLVWKKDYNGTAYTEMTVNLGNLAAGVYIVKLQFSNRTVVDRIVKQ